MEVKTIFQKIRRPQKEKKEYFFALQLDEGLVKSALWTIENEVVKVLSFGEKQFWEKEEEILEMVDASLPPAQEAEPSRVIFGITPCWIEGNKIISPKLELLKKICKELELSAVGFVVIPEAIVYHLRTIEGIPTTAILVNQGRKKTIVSLVRLGKIIGIQVVERSGDLGADLAEGLSRFGPQETFPPRIILHNQEENLEEEKQQLMNFSWSKFGINFLHLPKAEVLADDFDIRSVALAGGREVGKAEGIEVSPLKKEPEEPKEVKEPEETMGFVRGKDITQELPPKITPKDLNLPRFNFAPIFNFFSQIFQKIRVGFSFFGSVFSGQAKLVGSLVAAFLVIFGGIFVFAWWYLPKAEIVLWIKPQILEKDFTVKLDPRLTITDKEKLTLPAEEVEVVLSGEKKMSTTGTKLVGEPAKGEVVIYNGVGVEKKFPAGTLITSASGIKFTLEEDVLLASRSSAADPTPTKVVKVKAVNIGPEGNLASGSEFTIGNFSKSDYVAKNEEAFSGGTSREVQVVSKKDQEKLVEELTKELNSKAILELQTKVAQGKKLIDQSITSKVVEKTFDKDVDEEANEVGLKLRLKFTALGFSEEEFQKLVEEEILKAVPEGFEYKPEESETSFSLKSVTKEGVAVYSTHFKTSLFPKFDLEAIRNNLAGKYPEIGRAYLGTLPSVDSFEIKITPRFPARLTTFPRIAKNIKIEMRKK
ncbi:MAG: baseplate J/gp47 family protein [Microgenomates group bacterium]